MSVSAVATPPQRPRALLAIAVGGIVVGLLDLAYAIVVYTPTQPILVPQTIASGLLGAKSYDGGMQTAVLGTFLHFVIAIGAAGVYYLASRRIPFLLDHDVIAGLIYGALVFGFMHLVVLPLSNIPHIDSRLIYKSAEFVEHWFCVGLPISISVRHYSR
jgi:uncharacterized membrane protein YagU involved in acid resistance